MTYHNAVKYILHAPTVPNDPTFSGNCLKALWERLGNPQKNIKFLRLAGSSGKTVCAEMLVSILKNTSHKTGVLLLHFNSDLRESIRIDAKPLPFEEITAYIDSIYRAVNDMNKSKDNIVADTEANEDVKSIQATAQYLPTRSEILLTAALLAFSKNSCKFCIIESENSTTDPTRYLPTPISAAICGAIPVNDQKEIQQIRSYIRHGIQEIVSAPQDQSAYRLLSETCAAINCRLTMPTRSELYIHKSTLRVCEFSYKKTDFRIDLCGSFQVTNAIVVIEILQTLSRMGFSTDVDAIRKGFKELKLPARFEIISLMPTIIVDSTHTHSAVKIVCASMNELEMLSNKNIFLCLPEDQALANAYEQEFIHNGQSIKKLTQIKDDFYLQGPKDTPTALSKRIQRFISDMISQLDKGDVLIISGHSDFTLKMRSELLKLLSEQNKG